MKASESQAADRAIAAIQVGLDRFFAEADRRELQALRNALTRQVEADIAALDALADRIGEVRASVDATFAAYAAGKAVRS